MTYKLDLSLKWVKNTVDFSLKRMKYNNW